MSSSFSDKLTKLAGLLLLALGFAIFQYFFIPISVSNDSKGFYVNPTSFLHGSEKIQGVAGDFCSQKGQTLEKFHSGSKSMGGEYQHVYRFNCVAR